MKQSVILSTVGSAVFSAAHGIVSDLKIGNSFFGGYNPFQDPYMNPAPQRIVWAFPSAGNGPVEDVSSRDIVCNKGATAASLSAPVAAGDEIAFFWTVWPESHRGPVMTYLASCGGDCAEADPTSLSFFKIDDAGLNADGSWASDDLIANNNTWTVTVPSYIAPGNYILRHELLALHSAGNTNGAQFYPMCANLKISGSGSASPAGVKFPGEYSATDPGILVNIYNNPKSYKIPGPAVCSDGGSSDRGTAAPSATVPLPSTLAGPKPTAIDTTTVERPKPTASVIPPVIPSSLAPPAATATAPVPTGTPVPERPGTTFATVIRTRPNPAATNTPNDVNKCLDDVNACIRRAQNPRGGVVDFSACEAQRTACY